MKIFLDDIRAQPDGWLVIRTFDAYKYLIENHAEFITDISFDHDFGDERPNGVAYAKLTIGEYTRQDRTLPRIWIHSMNPVGATNIKNAFNDVGVVAIICGG
jgi:hypothetical protein